ncbi:hypothetical protein BGX33_012414 [Mortierella sp. NVP41]|nr:hypothetical protein BGX33_012414 [Mortierella sp. NVP41]
MVAKDIIVRARARFSILLFIAGSALFLTSAANVDFQPPDDNAPVSVAATSVSDPNSTPLTAGQIQEILDQHNKYRTRHSAPPLVWSDSLAKDADRAAADCQPFNSPSRYGRNQFTGLETDFFLAVQIWYDEIKGYSFEDPSKSTRYSGTFSQIVWKNSKRIGCAIRECPNDYNHGESTIFVHLCEYDPPGNTTTRLYTLYKKNILPAKSG